MARLHFTDGLSFDVQGPLRIERRSDGYYVLGQGLMVPVDDPDDGAELIEELRHKRGKKSG